LKREALAPRAVGGGPDPEGAAVVVSAEWHGSS